MTPAERAAVHKMAGAFSRLSVAAQMLALADSFESEQARRAQLERVRVKAMADFAAAMDALQAGTP